VHDFDIEPQKAHCADLLIHDKTNKKHYIVEFKVDAPTEEKQSPATPVFTSARGYCVQMKKRFPSLNGRGLTYTVLSKQREFDDKLVSGVNCRDRTWKELIPENHKETSLVADLLDSLGNFGISVLRLRNIRSMRNAQHAQGAFDIYELLQSILTDFRPCSMDIGSDETYRWFGMPIRLREKQHQSLQKWLGREWSTIGWIGYQLPKASRKPELAVWLYFEKGQEQHRDDSIQLLKKKLPRKKIEAFYTGDLVVSEPAARVADEKEWFTRTLQIVLGNSFPDRSATRQR